LGHASLTKTDLKKVAGGKKKRKRGKKKKRKECSSKGRQSHKKDAVLQGCARGQERGKLPIKTWATARSRKESHKRHQLRRKCEHERQKRKLLKRNTARESNAQLEK